MRVAWNVPRHLALIALAGATGAAPLAAGAVQPASAHAGDAGKGPVKLADSPRPITLDFVDAEISDIAKALSIQSGVNIIVSPNAKGKVTLRLKGMSLDEALRFISRIADLDFLRVSNTYVIGNTDDLRNFAARAGVSDTWTPQNLTPSEAKELVQAALPYVTVKVEEKSGRVVLLGSAEDVAAARKFLTDGDVPRVAPKQVQSLTPRYAKPAAAALLLHQAVPALGVQVHDRGLILTGSPAECSLAADLVSRMDAEEGGTADRITQVYQLHYLDAKSARESLAGDASKDKKSESADGAAGAQPPGAAGPEGDKVTAVSTTAPTLVKPVADTSPADTKLFPTLEVRLAPEISNPKAASFMPLSIESKTTFAGGAASAAATADANASKSRGLILTGSRRDVTGAIELLKTIDVAPAQVLIEARLEEMSPEKSKNLGLTYDFTPFALQELRTPRGTTSTTENGSPGFKLGRFIRSPFDINVTLNAMETNRDAKLLANPRISVVDGEDASIFIGDLLRYRVLQSVTTGGSEQFTVETVPVGIALLVRPKVGGDGNITLKVHPVVSTVTSFIGPEQIPQTASREADSTIRMKDGETVVIGGLIREDDVTVMSKVPGLGDLPLIGKLFTNKNTTRKKSDVTVFLTARLVPQ